MSKWERKFGKYAIPNLTVILIACYAIGYLMNWLLPDLMNYMTLNPYQILHGQVWRLFTWIIAPPITSGSNIFLILIMLMFYFSLGTSLERTWGTWQYNVYIFTGMLLTVLGSFLCMGVCYLLFGSVGDYMQIFFHYGAMAFSTYYINMSIFLAYAATFPNAEILLMFFIPVKVKWMGIIYGVMLVIEMIQYIASGIKIIPLLTEQISVNGLVLLIGNGSISLFKVVAIASSLLNFGIFWMRSHNHMHLSPKQMKRRAEFKHDIKKNPKITRHKCAVCGQTEESNPELEFRFCSKCNGNYEYCQYHLFTHEHIK